MEFFRSSTCKEVDDLVNDLVGLMVKRKGSGYRINMKLLLLELYVTYLEDPEQYLGYNRSRNFYSDRRKDYDCINPLVTADYMLGCVSFLMSGDYISHKPGGRFPSAETPDEYFTYVSRMRAKERLIKLWSDYKWQPHMVASLINDDLIILKTVTEKIENKYGPPTKVNKPIKFKPNPLSRQMYNVVSEYNARLRNHRIECNISGLSEEHKETIRKKLVFKKAQWLGRKKNADRDPSEYNPKIVLKLNRTSTYRVFNNADTKFRFGGRFYHGWWISCPSVLRKYITIDGMATCELDFSGMHIHILYALKGINYAARNEDPYILDGSTDKTDRKINKFILLTALNAEGDTSTAFAVNKKRRNDLDMHDLFGKHPVVTIKAKLEKLKLKHPDIAEDISGGVGLELQNHDSRIIEEIIKFCLKEYIPILTVHDSVIVPARYANLIHNLMLNMFADYISRSTGTKMDYSKYIHSSDVFIYLDTKREDSISKRHIINSIYRNTPITKGDINRFLDIRPVIKVDAKASTLGSNLKFDTKEHMLKTIKIYLGENDILDIKRY